MSINNTVPLILYSVIGEYFSECSCTLGKMCTIFRHEKDQFPNLDK